MAIASVNPTTGELLKSFEPLTSEQIEAKVRLASAAFPKFRRLTFTQRAAMMNGAAEILESDKEELGRLMTTEMGKTLRSAIDEAVKCAWACRYYAENAEKYLADEDVATNARRSYVKYQPIGVVLAIMPWNFPLWQVFRFIAPGLMAGNVGLLKHASNVPQCALKIEEILRRAGFPEGAFQTLLSSGRSRWVRF
jgi:succinate-semialdehyde dehydrogenase/glutarate-semialdehyde dehydrogenase